AKWPAEWIVLNRDEPEGDDSRQAEENEDGAVRRRTIEEAHAERKLREETKQEKSGPGQALKMRCDRRQTIRTGIYDLLREREHVAVNSGGDTFVRRLLIDKTQQFNERPADGGASLFLFHERP